MNCACGRPSPDAFLCVGCGIELAKLFAELPFWLGEIQVNLAKMSKGGGSGARAKGDDIPLPINLTASTLAHEARDQIVTWVDHLCESRGIIGPAGDEVRLAQWLLANVESVRQDEAGAVILDEFRDLQHRIERLVDRNEVRWFAGPCQAPVVTMEAVTTCNSDLYSRTADLFTGTGTIKCDGWRQDESGCSAIHDPAARGAWLLASITEQAFPLSLLLASVPTLMGKDAPLPGTVRNWKYKKCLVAVDLDRYGVEMFRAGDLIELMQATTRYKTSAA